jgi:hypothetical protein
MRQGRRPTRARYPITFITPLVTAVLRGLAGTEGRPVTRNYYRADAQQEAPAGSHALIVALKPGMPFMQRVYFG